MRRWLTHAIAPGAPLLTSVELTMHGRIRLGAWRAFTADQRLSVAGGFVWAANARLFGLPVIGFDRYTCGAGQMRWHLLGAVPVMAASGPDITRSAAGRHAGELLLAAPAAALSPQVEWRAMDAARATARVHLGPGGREIHEVTVTVAPNGALSEVVMSRWGKPGGGWFAEHVFGAAMSGAATFAGFTLPRTVTAGWFYGTDRWAQGQFIRYTIDDARYR